MSVSQYSTISLRSLSDQGPPRRMSKRDPTSPARRSGRARSRSKRQPSQRPPALIVHSYVRETLRTGQECWPVSASSKHGNIRTRRSRRTPRKRHLVRSGTAEPGRIRRATIATFARCAIPSPPYKPGAGARPIGWPPRRKRGRRIRFEIGDHNVSEGQRFEHVRRRAIA